MRKGQNGYIQPWHHGESKSPADGPNGPIWPAAIPATGCTYGCTGIALSSRKRVASTSDLDPFSIRNQKPWLFAKTSADYTAALLYWKFGQAEANSVRAPNVCIMPKSAPAVGCVL